MMDTVHPGSDDGGDKEALQPQRESPVGMVKENGDEENQLPQPDGEGARSDDHDLQGAIDQGEQQLAEMKAEGRRCVEIAVDVVHEVKTPEEGEAMIHPVPPPECVVEE